MSVPSRCGTLVVIGLLVAGVPLAGCIGSSGAAGDGTGGDADTSGPAATGSDELRFEDCDLQVGVFPIDASAAEPYLPDGFEPVPFQATGPGLGSGLPAPPGADAAVQITALACTPEPDQGLDAVEMPVVQAWLYVDPPDAFEDAEVGVYVVATWTVVTDPDLASTLAGWGWPVAVGDAALKHRAEVGDASKWGLVQASAGGDAVQLETPLVDALHDTVPEHIRIIGAADGAVTGVVDLVEEEHTHKVIGTALLSVQGQPTLPAPPGPGVSVHVVPGYDVSLVHVPLPAGA